MRTVQKSIDRKSSIARLILNRDRSVFQSTECNFLTVQVNVQGTIAASIIVSKLLFKLVKGRK